MANTTFSPKIFASETLRLFDRKAVLRNFTNTAYTGEIKKAGDTVHVQILPTFTFTAQSITNPSVATHVTGTGPGFAITKEDFAITAENLVINKFSQKRIEISDVEITQSNLSLDTLLADRFATGLTTLLDNEVRDIILVQDVANIPAGTKVNSAAPVTLTKTNVFEEIEKMVVVLKDQNVNDDLNLFIAPSVASLLRQSALLDNSDTGLATRIKGYMGMISGVKVIETTALTASKEMIMMPNNAVNFVVQITETKFADATDGFYHSLMAHCVYGGKLFAQMAKSVCVNYVA